MMHLRCSTKCVCECEMCFFLWFYGVGASANIKVMWLFAIDKGGGKNGKEILTSLHILNPIVRVLFSLFIAEFDSILLFNYFFVLKVLFFIILFKVFLVPKLKLKKWGERLGKQTWCSTNILLLSCVFRNCKVKKATKKVKLFLHQKIAK